MNDQTGKFKNKDRISMTNFFSFASGSNMALQGTASNSSNYIIFLKSLTIV